MSSFRASGHEPTEGEIKAPDDPWFLHALVRGRVQGVGFREFVRHAASELELSGWVSNLVDGRTVELEAAGPRERLERLLDWLAQGPRFAHVTAIQPEWRRGKTPVSSEFEIRR